MKICSHRRPAARISRPKTVTATRMGSSVTTCFVSGSIEFLTSAVPGMQWQRWRLLLRNRHYTDNYTFHRQGKISERLSNLIAGGNPGGWPTQAVFWLEWGRLLTEDWEWSSFLQYATGSEGRVEIECEWAARKRERAAGGHCPAVELPRAAVSINDPTGSRRKGLTASRLFALLASVRSACAASRQEPLRVPFACRPGNRNVVE